MEKTFTEWLYEMPERKRIREMIEEFRKPVSFSFPDQRPICGDCKQRIEGSFRAHECLISKPDDYCCSAGDLVYNHRSKGK